MVRIAKLGMEVFVDKAHGALIRHLAGDLQDLQMKGNREHKSMTVEQNSGPR